MKNEKFDLTDGDGMTMREIAAVEGISYQGVYYALQSAYAKIARIPRAVDILRAAAAEVETCRARRQQVEVRR